MDFTIDTNGNFQPEYKDRNFRPCFRVECPYNLGATKRNQIHHGLSILPMNRNPNDDSHLFGKQESRLTYVFWSLVLINAAVPLVMMPGLQFLEITPKLIVLVGGASVVWLMLATLNCLPALRQEDAVYLLLLAGLALFGVMSTVFSLDAMLSLAGSEGRRLGLPAWLASLGLAAAVPIVVSDDARRRRRLAGTLVIAGLLAATYGLAQYAGYDPWLNSTLYRTGAGDLQTIRPPSTMGHADWFAVFSLLTGFSAAGLALSSSTTRERWGWTLAVLLLAIAIVISGSRAAWLGAAGGTVLLCARIRNRRPVLMGILAVVALVAVFVISPLGRPLQNRIRTFANDRGVQARVLVWRDSLHLIAAHPLLGTGPDAFELGFPFSQSVELSQHAPENYVESPHNLFLDYLTNAGIPAGLIFAALLAMALGRYLVSSRGGGLDAGLLAALASGLVAMQFIGDTISTRLALLTIVALSARTRSTPSRMAVRLTVGTTAMACLVLVFVEGSRLVQADRSLWLSNRAASRGDIQGVLQEGLRARQSFPWSGTHAFAFSRTVAQLAVSPGVPLDERNRLLGVAQESARAGLLHSSQPQMVNVHLASLFVLQNQRGEARAALDAAVQAAPTWYRPRWLLAVLLAGQGQLAPAADHAAAALNLGARQNPEAATACLRIIRLSSLIDEREPQPFAVDVRQGSALSFDRAIVHPREKRPDTPNNLWAFPYRGRSFVTLPHSDLTFAVELPAVAAHARIRFRATVQMPLPGADLAFAVVRVNGKRAFSKLLQREQGVSLDLTPHAGQRIQLELAADPSPAGEHASWVEWTDPRIVVELAP